MQFVCVGVRQRVADVETLSPIHFYYFINSNTALPSTRRPSSHRARPLLVKSLTSPANINIPPLLENGCFVLDGRCFVCVSATCAAYGR